MSSDGIPYLLNAVRARLLAAESRGMETDSSKDRSRKIGRLCTLAIKSVNLPPKGLIRHIEETGLTAEESRLIFGRILERKSKNQIPTWVKNLLVDTSSYEDPVVPPTKAHRLGWTVRDLDLYFSFTDVTKMKGLGYSVKDVFESLTSKLRKVQAIETFGVVDTARFVYCKKWKDAITPELMAEMKKLVQPKDYFKMVQKKLRYPYSCIEEYCTFVNEDGIDFLLNRMKYDILELADPETNKLLSQLRNVFAVWQPSKADIAKIKGLGYSVGDFFGAFTKTTSKETICATIETFGVVNIAKSIHYKEWKDAITPELMAERKAGSTQRLF